MALSFPFVILLIQSVSQVDHDFGHRVTSETFYMLVFSWSLVAKKNTSHGSEVLSRDTTHIIQRPCYQRGSLCQDPAGNRTTLRSPDHRKETQTEAAWTSLPFIRSGQNHLSGHIERGKKTRQTGRGGKTTSRNG